MQEEKCSQEVGLAVEVAVARIGSLSLATIHDSLQTQTSSTWTLAANGLLINSVEKTEEFVAKLYGSTNQATNSITCRSIKVQFFKPA